MTISHSRPSAPLSSVRKVGPTSHPSSECLNIQSWEGDSDISTISTGNRRLVPRSGGVGRGREAAARAGPGSGAKGPARSRAPALQRGRRRFHVRHDSRITRRRCSSRVGALAWRPAGRRASSASGSSSASATRSRHANWLRDRGEAVPAADATHHRMKMNGVEHDMLMPGMLSRRASGRARQGPGRRVGRLFLEA